MASIILGYPSVYKTPSLIGTEYSFLPLDPSKVSTIAWPFSGSRYLNSYAYLSNSLGLFRVNFDNDGNIKSGNSTFKISEGENTIYYKIAIEAVVGGDAPNVITNLDCQFTIYGVENRYPLLPYTVNDVIQRVLQLVEPLRKNETPRFSFTPPTETENAGKAKLFSKFAPEFTFTRNTLREALQQIGGYIHAEPRLKPDMSLDWDFYGEEEKAQYKNYKTGVTKDLSLYKYRTLQRKRNLDETANALDSYQQNLVNRINWQNATTATPFDGGFQSLRMETAWVRAAEENEYHAETAENIDRIVKVEMQYDGVSKDITTYVYDKKVYDNLSGISETYPNAKVTSLYYVQGQKGIYGLFYKNPSAWGNSIGKNYAIVNIYNYVFGKSVEKLTYTDIQFRITYVPIYSTRVQQVKQYIQDFLPIPRTINYTQSENSVETAYFGENIKGAIARMGNAEKNVTMNFRNLDNIPKAGLLFDDDYYIAEVSTAVLTDHFEVTLGLSKNFNRKSKYIGASSIKRIYEVSEEQVQERHTVLQDYIVVREDYGNFPREFLNTDSPAYGSTTILEYMGDMFNSNSYGNVRLSAIVAKGYTLNGAEQENVVLPVIASAFGNTLEFTWRYKDNFSAGYQVKEQESGGVSGSFNVETEYTDYYGRLYYYSFALMEGTSYFITAVYNADMLPEFNGSVNGVIGTSIDNELVLRKDGREALKFTYSLHFVTDNKKFILGPALTTKNPLIFNLLEEDGGYERPHIYVLPNRVNRFASYVDLSNATDLGTITAVRPSADFGSGRSLDIGIWFPVSATVAGEAWVIAYPRRVGEPQIFETESGDIKQVNSEIGGEILIAKNEKIAVGDYVGQAYMFLVHDIYAYYDWLKKNN